MTTSANVMPHSTPSPVVAGFELGGTKTVVAIGTGPDNFAKSPAFPTGMDPHELLAAAVEWLCGQVGHAGTPEAIGVGSFGPINLNPRSPHYGIVGPTTKRGWTGADVLTQIRKAFPDARLALDTDVNVAALGEHRYGAGVGCRNLVYVTIGTGIGAGFLVDGKLRHHGPHPEVGHMRLPRIPGDSFSGVCPFHGDCWEGLCSGPALARRAGGPADLQPSDWSGWALAAQYTALALANLIYVAAPARVIVGGGAMRAGQLGNIALLQLIRQHLPVAMNGFAVPNELSVYPDSFLVAPGLGENAGLLGAMTLALTKY